MGQKIYENYIRCCNTPSDINQLLPILKEYGDQSNVGVEFGVRTGNSTAAFLASNLKQLYSYDINYNNDIKFLEDLSKEENRHFEFRLESSLFADIPECDLLFIDSLHVYLQLKSEMTLHHSKVKRFILLHDIVTFGYKDESGGSKGLMNALDEFLEEHKEWKRKALYKQNNGLGIIERIC